MKQNPALLLLAWIALGIMAIGSVVSIYLIAEGTARINNVGYLDSGVVNRQAFYCPGDKLQFRYTLDPQGPEVVRVVESWCRTDSPRCSLKDGTEQISNIPYNYPSEVVTATRTIPDLSQGNWALVHSVMPLGAHQFSDMFVVPFDIGECK